MARRDSDSRLDSRGRSVDILSTPDTLGGQQEVSKILRGSTSCVSKVWNSPRRQRCLHCCTLTPPSWIFPSLIWAVGFRHRWTILFEGHQRCNVARVLKDLLQWWRGGGGAQTETQQSARGLHPVLPWCCVKCSTFWKLSSVWRQHKGPPVWGERLPSTAHIALQNCKSASLK